MGLAFILTSLSITDTASAGFFGTSFTRDEKIAADQAKLVALTYTDIGVKVAWKNSTTGAEGYSIITYDFPLTEQGNCRRWYEWKRDKDGDQEQNEATMCFTRGRGWIGFSRQ
jgi:surface antigen